MLPLSLVTFVCDINVIVMDKDSLFGSTPCMLLRKAAQLYIYPLIALQENFLLREIFDLGAPIIKQEGLSREDRVGKVFYHLILLPFDSDHFV